ncbi:MAG TPA: class I mannose-6-phosphate isomerase, partial [Allosphingosinicella sp.]|nr:class I mannose-6-phosphate isomerase [Allosphingosinicella sp.]
MTAQPLRAVPVERVWGRRELPPGFPRPPGDEPIGEIWFETPAEAPLLVKYLFTSERLSIQVHPDDAAAQAKGYKRGKDEAWYVIDAAPDAVIGLGLTREISRDELRAAAADGSIEALLDWKPAKKGDVFYSPAGTIHAIGGGIALIEIQQNLDLTYRLYDYGRPRELHLDEAAAVARPEPWFPPSRREQIAPGRESLARGGAFTLERWT